MDQRAIFGFFSRDRKWTDPASVMSSRRLNRDSPCWSLSELAWYRTCLVARYLQQVGSRVGTECIGRAILTPTCSSY